MPISGDIVDLDLGPPSGREAGFRHPAVIVSAQRILNAGPSVIQVVPLTTTIRGFESEIEIEPDGPNRLSARSAAQCQHIRAISPGRIIDVRDNVGPAALAAIRETLATILDLA